MNSETQAIELQHKEPLLQKGKHGEYKYSADELSEIVCLDNNQKVQNSDMVLSSKLIQETYGGVNTIVGCLFSNVRSGIEGSAIDLQERQKFYGKNSFPPPKIKTIWQLIMENFDDTINRILFAAAIVSIIIGIIKDGFPAGLIEGTSIMIALNIIIIVNSGNNWISERRLADLVNLSEKQEVAVYRNSTDTITIDGAELVVGDLIKFEAGSKVPCDCILVEGDNVCCTEGELTGEPDAREKTAVDQNNYQHGAECTMLAKTLVTEGHGKAIVMAVGIHTVAGVITEKTQKASEPTLLQEKLESIATKIGNVGIGCAVLTFCAMLVRVTLEMLNVISCGCGNLFTCETDPNCIPMSFALNLQTNRLWMEILNTIIIAITVIVVAIPEGLPLAVTISLSFSSAKMRKLNNLVRKLASSETMGGATHICSDKTGTLTLNKMTTMSCLTLNKAHMMPGGQVSNQLAKDVQEASQSTNVATSNVWQMLVEGVLWNSSARIEKNDMKDKNITEEWVTKGNVTEQGLIKFFMGVMNAQGCIDKKHELTEENILTVIAFTSSRKRGSIVVRNPAQEGTDQEVRLYCKGAPDMVLDTTSHVIGPNGQIEYITSDCGGKTYRDIFDETIKNFADQAYRTLLITYKDMSMDQFNDLKARNNNFEKDSDRFVLEEDLTAIGLFGLQDPLRPTIVDSIGKCKTAGIQVIMCTGDNIDTAIAISKNATIVTNDQIEASNYTCMTGKNFREEVEGLKQVPHPNKPGETLDVVTNMKKFREIKQHLRVLARSSPEDKYLLVTGIQACKGVVAVTGDGTNDAPALTKADVGFSMGITGTDVAKGASDIILLDDNFSSIVVALKYGRNVYDNVRKFIQFQLTVNVVAMFIVFFGSVILKDSPLNAVQMLWVNLIMDTFAALALATEPPAHDVLTRMPYEKDAPIVTEIMWRNVFGHAIYQAIVLLIVLFAGQGWLVQDYSASCLSFNPADSTSMSDCTSWNPYYTESLYTDEATNSQWQKKIDDNHLTASDFDQNLLAQYNCQFKVGEGDDADWATSPFACTSEHTTTGHLQLPNEFKTDAPTQKLLHFTIVFQVFVFMQFFNQINARKIEEGEMNVFSGIFDNWLFIFVVALTIVIQMTMVEYSGKTAKCYPMNKEQNMVCLWFGLGELIFALILKFIPLKFFQCVALDEEPIAEDTKTLKDLFKRPSSYKRTNKGIQMEADVKKKMLERFTNLQQFQVKTDQE